MPDYLQLLRDRANAFSIQDSNKDIVIAFYNTAFNEHDPEKAARLYMGKTYIQHNPHAKNGVEGFINYVKTLKGKVEIKRVLADGDLVAVHSHFLDRDEAVVDIFRLENGKIVEHWDVVEDVPAESSNTNGMFSTEFSNPCHSAGQAPGAAEMDEVLSKEKHELALRFESTSTRITEFYNKCHDEDTGQFCEDPSQGNMRVKIEKASEAEHKTAKEKAKAWIRIAKVPPEREVIKSRLALAHARQSGKRADARANSAKRETQRHNLFKEFGGEKRGYVVDHQSGIKMHWTSDPQLNPNQYPVFTLGRIFTAQQGGGYTLDNLLPESFPTNRARGSRPLRKENL